LQVDVIVNSVSANLDLQKGFVSKELVEKAGDTIQKECINQHKEGIDIGNIAVTSAGNLKNYVTFQVNIEIEPHKTGGHY
jgi:O-acetyl-ADP-ribose deacetylase (regulator of RNase III)